MPDSTPTLNRLLAALAHQPLPARHLRQTLGEISPATLSRLTCQAGPQLAIMGQGRATCYGLHRDLRDNGWRFPVYRIDDGGDAHLVGEVWTLYGGYWWQQLDRQVWGSGFHPQLPWFLQDMKPSGYIGEAFARFNGPRLGLPERLSDWKDDDHLVAMVRRGEDLYGDLLIGEESLQRYLLASRRPGVTTAVGEYPAWAEASLAGALSLALAGGDQPKFCTTAKRAGVGRQVLVKFSPPVDGPTGQRWSDLLICEHIALGILRNAGIATAISSIHQTGGRTFLELKRFDRIGQFGRTPLHSLTVADDLQQGSRKDWSSSAALLERRKALSADDAARLVELDLFGRLIGNTERDFSNISLIPVAGDRTKYRLAPAYDMLPTRYKPRDGEPLNWEPYQPDEIPGWSEMHGPAERFWAAVSRDRRISEPFRKLCRANHDLLKRLEHGPRVIRPR